MNKYENESTQQRRISMSVAKTSEITASSSKSFEEAVRHGISKMSKSVDKIEGAWIKEQKVVVKDGEVTAYRVTMKVTFIVK
jgi:hypothetical protein